MHCIGGPQTLVPRMSNRPLDTLCSSQLIGAIVLSGQILGCCRYGVPFVGIWCPCGKDLASIGRVLIKLLRRNKGSACSERRHAAQAGTSQRLSSRLKQNHLSNRWQRKLNCPNLKNNRQRQPNLSGKQPVLPLPALHPDNELLINEWTRKTAC